MQRLLRLGKRVCSLHDPLFLYAPVVAWQELPDYVRVLINYVQADGSLSQAWVWDLSNNPKPELFIQIPPPIMFICESKELPSWVPRFGYSPLICNSEQFRQWLLQPTLFKSLNFTRILHCLSGIPAQGAFFSRMFHDLNQPLSTLEGYLHLAMHAIQPSAPNDESYLERMMFAAKRQKQLLEALSSYLRMMYTAKQREWFSVSHALQEVKNILHKEGNIDWVLPSTNLKLFGEYSLWSKAFQHITHNAIQYHQLDSPVKIAIQVIESKQGYAIVFVDNGLGVASNRREQIMQPFERLFGHHEIPGFGLGINWVQAMVESFGGSVHINFPPEGGASVQLDLPWLYTKWSNSG
jgi:signal transduction histidine kinase